MTNPVDLAKLARETDRSRPISEIVRPAAGWLRRIREALGLSLTDVARRLKVTSPAVRSFEQAEAEDRITLASLRRTAAAMNCELVYVLVPHTGTLAGLVESEARETSPAPIGQSETFADPNDKKVTDKTWRTVHGNE